MITPVLHVYEELSDTSRRRILVCLLAGARNVSEIVEATDLRQPNASNHLARMRTRGIVRASRIGRQVYYALANAEVEEAVRSVLEEKQEVAPLPNLTELVPIFAKASIQGDEKTVEPIYQKLLKARVPIVDLYQEVLSPAMRLVGDWYLEGKINEAQEHLASELTSRMMSRAAQLWVPTRENGLLAVLGNAPGNWHVLGLRMAADFLRSRGWQVLYLGANVPIDSFVEIVRERQPQMVLLSNVTEEATNSTAELIRVLRKERESLQYFVIGVGGTPFADHVSDGASFFAETLREFADEYLPHGEREIRLRLKLKTEEVSR